MDTRRRSDSRESGRPATASDQPVAEIVELGPVPVPKQRGLAPLALGLTVFAAGILAGSSLVRLAPADVAVATPGTAAVGASGAPATAGPSGSPKATTAPRPTGSPRPTGTPRPTVLPTPAPTNVPWAWTTNTFNTAGDGSPNLVSTAGGTFVVLVETAGGSVFRLSTDAVNWHTNYSSRAIAAYAGWTTVKDRLWFALRIAGLESDHLEMAYPTWSEDEANVAWTTLGPVAGAAPDWVAALGEVNGTWVMSTGRYVGEGGTMEISISDDGTHWSTIRPAGAEDVAIYQLARLGAKLVAFGQRQTNDSAPVALTTTDGRHWKSAAFPGASGGGTGVSRIACGDTACVAVGNVLAAGQDRPAMWRTTDGLSWQPVAEEITQGRVEGYLSTVVATASGFVAIGAPETSVLVSRDGMTWQEVNVLARTDHGQIQQLGVAGNVIFGLGTDAGGGNAGWVGDLQELPFP
jgi:hypothetical protein